MSEDSIKLKISIQPEMDETKKQEVLNQADIIGEKFKEAGAKMFFDNNGFDNETVQRKSSLFQGIGDTLGVNGEIQAAIRSLSDIYVGTSKAAAAQIREAFKEPVNFLNRQMSYITKTYNKTNEWSTNAINNVTFAQAYAQDYAKRIVHMTELMQPKANGLRAIGSADAAFFENFKSIREAYLTGLEELQHKQLIKSGSTSADVISGLLTSHKESTIYPKIIERFLGKVSPEEAKAYTQFMTASSLPFYLSSTRDSVANKTDFIRKFDGTTPYGHLPKQYRDLYEQAYLHDNDKIPKQIAPKSSYFQRDKIHDKAFDLIQKLAEEDNTGVLNDLAVSSGLAKRTGHTITWRGNGSIPQVQNYAASLVVEFERLRKGSKQWQDDALETDRYNRKTVKLDDAIEQLAEIGIVPQLYQNASTASNSPFNGKQTKVNAFGFPKQYIIPKTTYDEKGNLIYYEPTDEAIRVPKGQKAGVERKDQKFVGASDSAMMRMLRNIATNMGYTVDDELAYYTNKEGKKIPLMAKTSLTDVWDEARDETGWFPKEGFDALNKQTKSKIQHIGKTITNKTSMNGVPMSFGFMNEDDIYYIPTEIAEEYEKQRKSTPGATSFFNAGNAIPLEKFADREALVKQLNNMHMFNTPSHGEEEYFATKAVDKEKQLNSVSTEFINWTALNKLYEKKTGKTRSEADILDSLAFITPTREGDAKRRLLDSGFQGRAGTFLKFGAVLGDLPETLKKSGIMGSGFGADEKFMVPSVAFDESDEALMHDLYRYYFGNDLPTKERMTPDERTSFASKWLRDATDDAIDLFIADTSVKSTDKGRILPKQDYEEMMKQMLKGSMPEAEIPKEIQRRLTEKEKTGLINNGYVGLYGDEYTHRMNTDINFHGGIAAARETGAFEVDKRFMPISMAQSLNLPFSAYQESLDEYNKMFQNWKDPSWVMEHGFASMPAYQRELKRNPAFIESEPAKQYIQSQVAQLREHMLKQDLMLKTPAYSAMGGMTTGMALDFLSELTGNKIDKTSEFAPLFKSALLEMYNADTLLKDKNVSKEEKEYIRQHKDEYDETLKMIQEDRYFIAPGLKGSKAVGERYPAAYGTGVAGRNLYYNKDGTVNQRIANALKASGASEDVFYLPSQAMYKMNTGDYDGDTVWAYISKADAWLENVEKIDERMKEAKTKLEARRTIQEEKAKANNVAKEKQTVKLPYGEEVLRASYLNTASKAAMGLGSAVLRNALQLPDSDPDKMAAILEGVEYYDLATSQIKKAGKTDVTLGKEGFQALLVGGNFDRLMKEVFAYSNADEEARAEMVFPSIFKSNIGSIFDPNATGATLMNQVTARQAGGSFALKKKVSDYLGHVYDMGSALGRAASWYGNIRVGDLTGEHFVTDDDVLKGLELLTEVKQEQLTKGSSVQQVYDREIRAFEKVLDFMQSDKARSQKNINEVIAAGPNENFTADYIKGLKKINRGQNRGYLSEIEEVLQTERQEMIDNQILAQEMAKDEKFKQIQGTFVNNPYEPKSFPQKFSVTATEAWFDKKKLPNVYAEKIDLSPTDPRKSFYEPIFDGKYSSFGNYEHRAKQEASEIMNSNEQDAHIILGNYMHSAFENFWSPDNKIFKGPTFAEQMKEQGQTDENLIYGYTKEELDQIAKNANAHFMDLLSGRKKRKNEATGLMTTIKDELAEQGMDLYLTDNGTYRVKALPGERDTVQQERLNNDISVINSKLESMQTEYGKDGNVLSYGSIANLAQFMYKMPKTSNLRVVGTEGRIFGLNGEVLWDEKEKQDPTEFNLGDGRTVRSHTIPDAMFEIDGKYYILDYKSRDIGAKDSLAQSMLYQKQYEERAERALRDKNYNNPFSQFGYIDKNDEFVSNFGGVLGFDARGNAIFKYAGAHSEYEGRDVIDVLQEQYIEAIKSKKSSLLEGHYTEGQLELIRQKDAELAEYAAKNLIPKATITQATEAVANAETRAIDRMTTPGYSKMSDAETDFYIARYTQDKETLDEIEKNLNSENSKLFRKNHPLAGGYDRFKSLREQLDSTLGNETLDRMIEIFNTSPTISADLRHQMTRKSDAMQKLFDVQSAYATEDVEDARKNIMSMLYGVDFSKGSHGLAGIWNQLSRARATKEGLIADSDIYNETEGFRTKANLEGLTNQTAIEMERTRARKAQQAKDVYEDATERYNSLLEFVDNSSFDKIVKIEKSEGEVQLRKILEKPLETSTIDDFFDNKVNALIGYVEQKNANIEELEKIVKDSGDQKLTSAAKDLIAENRKQRNEAMEYFKDPLKFIDIIDKKSGKDGSKHSAIAKIDKIFKEQEDLRAIKLAIAQSDSATLLKYGLSDEQLISKGLKHGNSTSPYDNDIVKLREKARTQKLTEDEEGQLTSLIGKRRSFFETFGETVPALPIETDQYKNTYTRTFADASREAEVIRQNEISKQYWEKWKKQNVDFVNNTDKLQELSVLQNTVGGGNQKEIERLARIQKAQALRENYIEQKNNEGEYRFSEEKRSELRDSLSDEAITKRIDKDLEYEEQLKNIQNDIRFNQFMRQRSQLNRSRYGGRGIVANAIAIHNNRASQYEQQYLTSLPLIKLKQDEIENMKQNGEQGTDKYNNAVKELTDLQKASLNAKEQMNSLNKTTLTAGDLFSSFGRSVDMIVHRLGRQMFMKALNEAKRFVKEFDKAMTTIQMITLKSDTEMSKLGDGLINKAKELKISIGDITQSAAILYRQGLTDQEVNNRLDVISKFSKVSGTKIEDATKLITVAMNTGLVTDASEAADIVTALGDNAATNAQQIEKGIEKAGAAAAADGTTFGQLAAMLTAITSTTQIGGNVAGRTLNTIIGRMNKIGTDELIIDENGNKISGSAVSQLLKAQGVNTYDENGNKRSTFDILYDLSKKWDSISDAEQQQLATAIAGTRQYSNFSAIMQGMNEGKIDEYMELIGESSGITDKKYEIQTKSLEAALNDLRNTFDSVIRDLADKGVITNITKGIGDIVTGIGAIISSAGGLKTVVATMALLAVTMSAIRGGAAGAALTAGMLLSIGAVGLLGSSINANNEKNKTAAEINADYTKKTIGQATDQQNTIDRYKELSRKNSLSDDERKEFQALTVSLGNYAGLSAASIESLTSAIGALGDAASGATPQIKKEADRITKEAQERVNKENRDRFVASLTVGKGAEIIAQGANAGANEYRDESYGSSTKFEDAVRRYQRAGGYAENIDKYGIGAAIHDASDFLRPLKLNFGPNANGVSFSDEGKAANEFINTMIGYFTELSGSSFISDEWFTDIEGNPIDPEKWKNKDAAYWKEVLKNAAMAGWNPWDENVALIAGMQRAHEVYSEQQALIGGNPNDAQREGLEKSIAEYLTSNKELLPFNEDLIPYIAKTLTEQYYKTAKKTPAGLYEVVTPDKMKDLVLSGLGYDNPEATNEDIITKALELANKSNYQYSEADKLAMAGLPDGDFFIDQTKKPGEKGYIISAEEAEQRMKTYRDNRMKKVTRYAVRNKDDEIVIDENGEELVYDTKEQQQEKVQQIKQQAQDVQTEIDNRQAEISEMESQLTYSTIWSDEINGNHTITETGAGAKERAYQRLQQETAQFIKENPYVVRYNHDYVDENGVLHKKGEFIDYSDKGTSSSRTELPMYDRYLEDENGNRTQTFYGTDIDRYVYGALNNGRHVYSRTRNGKIEYFEADSDFLEKQAERDAAAYKYAQEQYITYGTAYNPTRYKRDGHQLYMMDPQIGRINLTDKEGRITQAGYAEAKTALSQDKKLKTQLMDEYMPQYKYEEVTAENMNGHFWEVASALGVKTKRLYDVTPLESLPQGGETPIGEKAYNDAVTKITEMRSSLEEFTENTANGVFEFVDSIVEEAKEIPDEVFNTDNIIPKLEGHKRRFLGKAASGYQAWKSDDKNSYALAADEMLRYVWDVQNTSKYSEYDAYISPDNKYKAIQKLLYATDIGDNATWGLLYSSNEFARIMDQVKTDEAGNIISAPDDIMEQITRFLASKGRDYGPVELTSKERAQRASIAFNGLTNQGWYVSQDAYNTALDADYNENVYEPWKQKYEERIKEAEEQGDIVQMTKLEQRYRKQVGLQSKESYAQQRYADAKYLEEADTEYLNSIIGKRLTQKAKGLNGGLTDREKAYAAELLNNAQYGITGLTTAQRLKRIKEIQSSKNIKEFSEEELAASLYGFGNATNYIALREKKESNKELTAQEVKDLQAYEQELKNLQNKTEIELEIQGLAQLEEAGELLEGTAALVEKLKKGGKFEVEAIIKIRQETYAESQLAAMLTSGTKEQQRSAIMELTGASESRVIKNFDYWKAEAERNIARKREDRAKALLIERDLVSASELASFDAMAAEEGYKWIPASTFIMPEGYEVWNNGNEDLIVKKGTHDADYALTEAYQNQRPGYYEDTGAPDVDFVNELLTQSPSFTKKELMEARKKIINGTFGEVTNQNSALYMAAFNGLGENTQELVKRQERQKKGEKVEISEGLKTAARNEQRNEPTFTEEDYDLSTSGGALRYQQLNYAQNNKTAIAANSVYRSLTSGKINSVADLAQAVNKSDVDNWAELLASSDELRKSFKDLGIEVGADGKTLDFSGVEDSADGLGNALNMLASIIGDISSDYNKKKDVDSLGEKYEYASDYINGTIVDEEKGFEALSEVTGNSALAQVVRNNWSDWKPAYDAYAEYASITDPRGRSAWVSMHGGVVPTDPGEWNPYKDLTPYNEEYAQMLFENAQYGQAGLTDLQRYEGLQDIVTHARQGTLGTLREQDKIGAFSDYMSDTEGYSQWLMGQQALEDVGMTMFDLGNLQKGTEEYEKAEQALKGIYDNVELAAEAHENFSDSVATAGQKLKKNKDYLDAYNIGLKQNSKNLKEANQAQKAQNQMFSQIQSDQYVRQNYKKNRRKYASEVAQMTGYDKQDVLSGKFDSEIDRQLQAQEQEQIQQVEAWGDGFFSDINDKIAEMQDNNEITIDASNFHVRSDGTIDLSEIQGQLGPEISAQIEAEVQRITSYLSSLGITGDVVGTMNGNHFEVKVVVSDLGEGRKGGGGGGGGGKSAVDKLLEKQKHEIGQIAHQQKMLEEAYKGLEFNYDYAGQIENTKDQIATQKELISTYESHISELESMMAKQKEYSDDWWKLKEAIDSARESIASANNEINELKLKQIEIVVKRQEDEVRPITHKQTMRETYAQTALTQDRYSDYVAETQEAIKELEARRDKRRQDINELKEKLKQLPLSEKGEREELKKQIEEAEEDAASLDSDLASKTQELQSQQLSHVAQVLSQNTQTATHNQNMASAYASEFQTAGYRSQYTEMIKAQMTSNDDIIKHNQTAIQDVKALMDSLEQEGKKGSTAWFEAQAALYGYEEAIAQATTSQMELNRALEESKIEETAEKYTDATREIAHVQELLSGFASEALERNDYDSYFAAMDRYLDAMPDKISAARTKLSSLQEQYDSGMKSGTLDPATQRRLLDEINTTESEIAEMERDQRTKIREVGKQKITQLTEAQDWDKANYEHNQKLISYQASTYQNQGELTNYGIMLETDTQLRKDRISALEDEKDQLNALLNEEKNGEKVIESGSDEEQRIIELIRQHDEAIASESAQIEKNNKLLEENQKKILKVRKTLEDAVDKEIEAQKKREREILAGNVSMQNTILDLLKKRLQDEWNLKKKDLNKEKENLAEYKKLINERFAYRKKASQQADKDEELADYRRQLALIEADPTRTREAKELRKKIEDLEKEQSWTIAEDQLEAENLRIDDETEAIDKYVSYSEEKLNEILSDANNFADELNGILSGSYEESYKKIMEFMETENEAFMKSLPDAQRQMIQGWEDTWKKAKDILDNNYSLIKEYLYDAEGNLRSEEEVISWFKANDRQYRDYIENGDQLSAELKVREWQDAYRNVVAALKDDAVFTPDDYQLGDVVSLLDQLDESTYKVQIVGIDDKYTGDNPDISDSMQTTEDFSIGLKELEDLDKYFKEVIKQVEVVKETITKPQGTPTGGKKKTTIDDVLKAAGIPTTSSSVGGLVSGVVGLISGLTTSTSPWASWGEPVQQEAKKDEVKKTTISGGSKAFASGGLVDYTGPAWVDGTLSNPEAFLSAKDTRNIRALLDAFDYISVSPGIVPATDMFTDNSTTVGDINVTINQAELKKDADFEDVAKRVGQAFTKELQRNGLNLSGYAFG